MTKDELIKWFDGTEEDELFKKNEELIDYDRKVQEANEQSEVVMLWVPEEDRYIYQAINEKTTGTYTRDIVKYIRKNHAVHSKIKGLITD